MGWAMLLAGGFLAWNWLQAVSQQNARLFTALSREAQRRGVAPLRAVSVPLWSAPIAETLDFGEEVTTEIYYPRW